MKHTSFAHQIEVWLKSSQPKTVASLETVFEEKTYAIAIVLLMFVPALPLPTGGLTHIFEIIAACITGFMVVGGGRLWLPQKLRNRELGPLAQKKSIPFLMRRIRWMERHSRPRLAGVMNHGLTIRICGLIMLTFITFAFFAPPFSGLDTLPSLGVVCMALSLILDDFALLVMGLFVGLVGSLLVVLLGRAVLGALF